MERKKMKKTQWVKHKHTHKNTKSETPSDTQAHGGGGHKEGKKERKHTIPHKQTQTYKQKRAKPQKVGRTSTYTSETNRFKHIGMELQKGKKIHTKTQTGKATQS